LGSSRIHLFPSVSFAPSPPTPGTFVDDQGDRLDLLLTGYERRKQDETHRQVQRAIRLEATRKVGAEQLRRYAVEVARDAVDRLQTAGHRVVYHEFLDAYPPSMRIHLWPKKGPLDEQDSKRTTLELVWGDPDADALCATRWSEGLHHVQHLGSARKGVLDELWVREQILDFLRETLGGA
jgi:hypothetical protein